MTEKSNLNPEEKGQSGNEETQTPEIPKEGTETGKTPAEQTPPKGDQLPPQGEQDYQKKFSESSRENQRIIEESKLKDERIAGLEVELEESKPPSDKEIADKTPNWDLLEEEDKEKVRKDEVREKRLRKIEESLAWEEDFRTLTKQDEFVSLKEEEDKFKEFAYKYPKSVDLLTLAKSYLYGKKPKSEPEPERKGLEQPTFGNTAVSSGEMTLEDIKRLREEDPKAYIKAIREGRIKNVPEASSK